MPADGCVAVSRNTCEILCCAASGGHAEALLRDIRLIYGAIDCIESDHGCSGRLGGRHWMDGCLFYRAGELDVVWRDSVWWPACHGSSRGAGVPWWLS